MRLIDTDDLIRYIKSAGLGTGIETEQEDIIKAIESCPVVYDAGKVVKQLESLRDKEYEACTDVICEYCKYSEECYEGEKSGKLAIDRAIEIVKGGGIE